MHYIHPLALSCPLNCAGYYGLAPTAAPSVAPTAAAPIPAETTIAPTPTDTTIETEIETETQNSTATMEEEDIWGDFLGPNTDTTTATTTGDEVEEEVEEEVIVVEEEDLEVVVVIEDVVDLTDTTTTTPATTTGEEEDEDVVIEEEEVTSALNSTTFAEIIRNKVPYCAAYPMCKNVLVRSCCPTEEGVMLDCCSGIPTTATVEEEEEDEEEVVIDEEVVAVAGAVVEEDENVPAEDVVVVVVEDAPSTFARNSTAAAEFIRATGPRCAAYSMCTALVRKCCPTDDGMMLDCCYGIPTTETDSNSTTAAIDVEAEEVLTMGGLEDIVDGMIP